MKSINQSINLKAVFASWGKKTIPKKTWKWTQVNLCSVFSSYTAL